VEARGPAPVGRQPVKVAVTAPAGCRRPVARLDWAEWRLVRVDLVEAGRRGA